MSELPTKMDMGLPEGFYKGKHCYYCHEKFTPEDDRPFLWMGCGLNGDNQVILLHEKCRFDLAKVLTLKKDKS